MGCGLNVTLLVWNPELKKYLGFNVKLPFSFRSSGIRIPTIRLSGHTPVFSAFNGTAGPSGPIPFRTLFPVFWGCTVTQSCTQQNTILTPTLNILKIFWESGGVMEQVESTQRSEPGHTLTVLKAVFSPN